jgi:magnesium chelatase family protein
MSASIAPIIRGRVLGLGIAQAFVLIGLDALPVRVEVATTRGPAFFQMVGLAEAAVRESRVRVASALARLGILLDEYAVTVNLAPGDLRKSGAALDLAIAIALLAALERCPQSKCDGIQFCGELSLRGELLALRGLLPLLEGAKRGGARAAIVPACNSAEAGLVRDIDVHVAADLAGVVAHLSGACSLPRAMHTTFTPDADNTGCDLADVRGQAGARRA